MQLRSTVWLYKYNSFTDKVERNGHFPTEISRLIVRCYKVFSESHNAPQNNTINLPILRQFLGEPGSDICVELHQWTHCIRQNYVHIHPVLFGSCILSQDTMGTRVDVTI
jgi:hypothetical protein